MDIEKFTERTRGFLQAAQTIAIREFHQQITPQHLLKALLDDEEGAAAGLIKTAGGDPKAALTAVETDLARQPKVQGVRRRPAADHARPGAHPGCGTADRDQGRRRVRRAGPAAGGDRRVRHAGRPCPARCRRQSAGAGEGGQRHPQGPQGHQPERRIQLRRAEEIRPRHHRARARGQARSGDRARRGNPPHHPGAGAPHQEQSRADRRARRRQDRHRRWPGAAHRQWRRARGTEGQAASVARSRRIGRRVEVSRRVRGTAEGRAEGDGVRRGPDHPVHRRTAQPDGRGPGRRLDGCVRT